MAKYTVEQKTEAVRLYLNLGKEGICYFNDIAIHNIRDLCSALNVSSQSIYRWAEEFTDVLDDEEEDNLRILEKPIRCDKESWCKAYQSLSDSNETCNALNVCDDKVVSLKALRNVFDPHDYPKETYDEGIFNGRFYAWLSAGLNVPYASQNAKATNMLKIGLELIKRSGLIDCDKVKKAMRV